MQTETVEMNEAQAHFKELMHRVVSGIHVVLSEGQKPVAHIVPIGTRVAGLHSGSVWVREDFDAPLADEYWSGGK